MSAVVYKAGGRNGDYVKATLIPANHSEEPRFGAMDCAIIGFFVVCLGGLLTLVLI